MGSSPEGPDELEEIVRTWSKAQVMYDVPSFEGVPRARYLAESTAASRPDLKEALLDLSTHENQLVAAYAILTLRLMDPESLALVPESVGSRKDRVTLQQGSFRLTTNLGDWLRRMRRIARGEMLLEQ